MVNFFRALGQRMKSLSGKTKSKEVTAEVAEQARRPIKRPADLDIIYATVHHGCMGIPQELVDHTMEMLHDDFRALKACSLTCKAMFVSTRRLIHQTLYLIPRNNRSVLTQQEESRYRGSGYKDVELRFLSYMGERGLLQRTQQVHIRMSLGFFTQEVLLPHLHYFQSLEHVKTLSIEPCNVVAWAGHYKTYFDHFHPTLTSLTLSRPFGSFRLLLQFALQFPNLQNMCLEWPLEKTRPDLTVPAFTNRSPPLGGHLRLAGAGPAANWSADLAHELQNGINFRSIELEDFTGYMFQRMLDACASTLEQLAIKSNRDAQTEMLGLGLTNITILRRLTCCVACKINPLDLQYEYFLRTFSTITSPVFRELVLELRGLPYSLSRSPWGQWRQIDKLLENRFAKRGDFRLIIRTGRFCYEGLFRNDTKRAFPLLESKGCIRFEKCDSMTDYLLESVGSSPPVQGSNRGVDGSLATTIALQNVVMASNSMYFG